MLGLPHPQPRRDPDAAAVQRLNHRAQPLQVFVGSQHREQARESTLQHHAARPVRLLKELPQVRLGQEDGNIIDAAAGRRTRE